MNEPVGVHVALRGETVRAGTAYFHRRRSALSTTFTYDPAWLADRRSFALDPSLPLVSGSHATEGLPGSFEDCSPDRWGRNLITRRARATARQQRGAPPSLSEIDYLLSVSDHTRQGALRFRIDGADEFLAHDREVPRLIELPRLLRAAETVAHDSDDDYEAVQVLLDAGTGSLGGARPKATVRSDQGRLLIAKFPHHHDQWDIAVWEKTALDLAEMAGVRVPERSLVPIGPGSTLLLARFDRAGEGLRIPYISALTLMSGRDGDSYDYADLATELTEFGAGDNAELEALFRRVVVSVAIHNTDDHLRNTGFLRGPDGWRLSPVFDINPNPDLGGRRQTAIGSAETVADEPEGLMHLAEWCHLDPAEARQIVAEVLDAMATWKEVAARNGASAKEVDRFSDVFEHERALLGSVARSGSAPIGRPSAADGDQPRQPRGTPRGGQFRPKHADEEPATNDP